MLGNRRQSNIGRRNLVKWLVALLCTAFVVVSGTRISHSQQGSLASGEIKGVLVEEATSRPVVGQTLALWGYDPKDSSIIAIRVAGKLPPKVTTDPSGKFSFASLPAGTYAIAPDVGGISQGDNLLTITSGPLRTVAIVVKDGQSVDLGLVKLLRMK